MNLSAWPYHRLLKLVRTSAALMRAEQIQPVHRAEVIHLRSAAADGVGHGAWVREMAYPIPWPPDGAKSI